MSQVVIGKWGKNLAIRFPADVARAAGLGNGQQVDINTRNGEIVIRRIAPEFTLEELFKGKSAKQWRAAYARAYDWGRDVGREVIEE